jgi:hypothetical protein
LAQAHPIATSDERDNPANPREKPPFSVDLATTEKNGVRPNGSCLCGSAKKVANLSSRGLQI